MLGKLLGAWAMLGAAMTSTPRPWKIDPKDARKIRDKSGGAVNAHEELVAFTTELAARCAVWGDPDSPDLARQHLYHLGAEARALLARIKGEA